MDALVVSLKESPLLRMLGRKLCHIKEDISKAYNLQVSILSDVVIHIYTSFKSKIPLVSRKAGHVPSPTSGKRIRLLRVHAAGPRHTIECTLDWCQLSPSMEPYTAISYVWGSSDRCCEIKLNGRPFRTTQSAADVLAALRSSWRTKTFWIDAICIDQDDDNDKEHQIPHMAAIYEKAAKVVVWLGDAEDGHIATSLVRKLWFRSSLVREFGGSLVIKDIHADAWKALGTMLNHPWFQRVWIIQEVVVAKGGDIGKDSVFIRYGHGTIDWTTFSWFIRECFANKNILQKLTNNNYTNTVNNVRAIEEVRSVYRREGPNLSLLFYLGRLFRSGLKFEATVTKDRVFSLLNLTAQGLYVDGNAAASESLVPNYLQSDGQLFTNIAKHLLMTLPSYQQLDILAHAGLLPGIRTPNIPSWAPDWAARPVSLPFIGLDGTKELLGHPNLTSRLLGIAAMRSHGDLSLSKMLGQIEGELRNSAAKIPEAFYRAGFPLFASFEAPKTSLRQLREKSQLKVAGIGAGRIAHLASQFSPIGTPLKIEEQGSVRLNPAAFIPRDWRAFAYKHSNISIVAYNMTVLGELTQTWVELTEEGIPSHDFELVMPLMKKIRTYEQFIEHCLACEGNEREFFVDDAGHEFYKIDRSIRTICSGRILGVTDQGQLGLFPAGTRIGDSVSIFVNASVPFVVRAVGGEVSDNGVYEPFYQLVGPCYVQGVMFGEAMDDVLAEHLRWYFLE